MTPWTTLSFEGTNLSGATGNILPLNWSQWSSDPHTAFSVTNTSTNPALSGSQSIAVTSDSGGVSGAVTRAWPNNLMPADVQVSAAIYVSTLIPAQLIARGSNLDLPDGSGTGPSFYALQLSRSSPGPLLELVKDVDGTLSSLLSINAPTYIENEWVRAMLTVPNTDPPQYQHWCPAAAYNIGTPLTSLPSTPAVFDTGPDPENTSLTYTIFQRSFTGQGGQTVLVLYKPLSTNGSESGTTDDATATTHDLTASYYLLQADGTLSSTSQTTVTLRNGEGAILVPAGAV